MKKLLAVILSLLIIFLICPFGAFAATVGVDPSGNYTYTVSNGEVIITDCSYNISGAVTIPSTLGGHRVTSIGNYAFSDCVSLTSVSIPTSIISIGNGAFARCSSLKRVVMSDTVTSIGDSAFADCSSLVSITISKNITSIGKSTFSGCAQLISINIPNSVTSIGDQAFYDCSSLTTITIPDSVNSIGSYAFSWCSSLANVNIPDKVSSIGQYTFSGCSALTNVILPNSVTSIESSAFYQCLNLTDVKIGNSVTTVGSDAFYNTAWYNNKPEGLVYVGRVAYKYKGTSPTTVSIKEGVVSIACSAFVSCSKLTSITIPDSVTNIDYYAFSTCKALTDVWFTGSEAQKSEIIINSNNQNLTNATWHYNTCAENHSYLNGKDTSCELCDWMRICGDFDGNNLINASDLLLIKTNVLNTISNDMTYDITGDGVVDVRDLVRIKRIAAGIVF